MENLIICVGMFYILHLFLTMSFSLHKVPFVNWTVVGGDISGMTELSSRMSSASDNLRQSLPVFMTFAVLSVVMGTDNLLLAQIWFGLRIGYLIGAAINLYKIPMIRPLVWLPSIVVLVMMGLNLCTS
ncbi:MAG: MAPEG family protein [Gammaproteobacteria bacterium]|tara:strand:- start:4799 stop:5182 length:384 start_codon:yes stop_codon:yes gene_type:complete